MSDKTFMDVYRVVDEKCDGSPESNAEFRERLTKLVETEGWEDMVGIYTIDAPFAYVDVEQGCAGQFIIDLCNNGYNVKYIGTR